MFKNVLLSSVFVATLWAVPAQTEEGLPALPPLPGNEALPTFPDDLQPLAQPLTQPQPITPLAPDAPEPTVAETNTLPTLPDITDQENFQFFQQGTQLPPLPSDSLLITEPVEIEPEELEAAPSPQRITRRPHARPFQKRFNYKRQYLSARVYRTAYAPQNRHLPVKQTQAGYDAATFNAAASNNLNGLRAMLEYGGRSHIMRNERGETLADVAYRYRALDTLHYLITIGVPRS